jgi:MEMO1 family protein
VVSCDPSILFSRDAQRSAPLRVAAKHDFTTDNFLKHLDESLSEAPLDHLVKPRLRGVDCRQVSENGNLFLQLFNREELSDQLLQVPQALGLVLQFFDGERTTVEIADFVRTEHEVSIDPAFIKELAAELDHAVLLDGPSYEAARRKAIEEYRAPGVRPAKCLGVYSDDPKKLRDQLRGIFEHPKGAGLPTEFGKSDDLRAVFVPHIDYRRGGPSFGYGFRELAERSQADTFVVVATSHYSPERLTLTRNHFATPLGVVQTDRDYVDALAEAYGVGAAYADELAHRPEHSIELEVVLMQYLFGDRRPFKIVPLLVGPFQDAVDEEKSPSDLPDVRRMIEALQQVERDQKKRVCYVVSGDLAHIGPKFGDEWEIDGSIADWNRGEDEKLLTEFSSAKPDRFSTFINDERDERRVCGFPPGFTTLAAAKPSRGKTLYHNQFVDPKGYEIVSFASVAFDR